MKIKKKWGGGRGLVGGQVRVDVIEELKFLGNSPKKYFFFLGGGGGSGWGGGGGGQRGCE